ncbi:MAG: insulinase family protein [Saprospiraceae bacterium]|nr:insulinase family protein [Saprospiraceae bacterium]
MHADVTTGTQKERFSYGQAPKAQVEMSWTGPIDFENDAARFHFTSLEEVMKNKLRESMREDQGGVYGVGVSGSISKYPKEEFSMTISFNAEPDQVDKLIATAKKILRMPSMTGPMKKIWSKYVRSRYKRE